MKTKTLIIGCLLLAAFAISTMNIASALPTPSDPTKAFYAPDCNDPDSQDIVCADINRSLIEHNGYEYYVGHDEPGIQFLSNIPGSGNNFRWEITLPTEPTPTQDGTKVANFELYEAYWLSLALCDPNSFPFGPCTPNSDVNNPDIAGSAFLELQFFPPGLESSDTQWSMLLHINSFERNNSCKEPITAAYITEDGTPGGPKLLMNNGDEIVVTMRDTGSGLEIIVNDLSTAKTGSMKASGGNGFKNTDPDTCIASPFDYHPEFSTANSLARVGLSFETGHWELCGDSACNAPPDLNDSDDFPFSSVRGIGGSLDADSDKDGTPYHANWPDGSANHPTSLIIGAPDGDGFGPLSFDGSNYLEGYNKIHFAKSVDIVGTAFYPFFSQSNTGTSCRLNFGNDIPGITTNDFGKTAQYGTTINNPCLSGNYDYSLSISPPINRTILTGDAVTYEVTATLNSGSTVTPVTLSASGLPSGATASFIPAIVTPNIDGASSSFQINTSNPGGLGDFILVAQGTAGGLTRTANANLHLYDFTISVSPSDRTVLRGGGTSYNVTATITTGSTDEEIPGIRVGTIGLPVDVGKSFSHNLVPTTGSDTTTLTVRTTEPPSGSLGDFPFSVIGPIGPGSSGNTRTGTSNLHIYDFSLAAIPSSLQILTNGSNNYSISDTLVPGSSSVNLPSIDLSLSGLPSGATGIFNPISGSAGGFSSILGITTSNTPNGTDLLTVTGKDSRTPEGGTRVVFPTLVPLMPQQVLQLIIDKINVFQSGGVLVNGQANSLIVKFEHTQDKLNSSKKNTACNDLGAFINEVRADVKSGKLTQAQADTLLGGPLGVIAIMKAVPC